MTIRSQREAAETLGSLESLQARTLADSFRWTWLIWLLWAAVSIGSVAVFLAAPNWAIGVYWLCTLPIAVGAAVVVLRRLPGRVGVVPQHRRALLVGSAAVGVVALATAPISALGPAVAVSFGMVAFGWIWPRRLAITIAAGLAVAAAIIVLLVSEREATVAIACLYAAAFAAYAFFERARLRALR